MSDISELKDIVSVIKILNQNKHRGRGDWAIYAERQSLTVESLGTKYQEAYRFDVFEARAIAEKYLTDKNKQPVYS